MNSKAKAGIIGVGFVGGALKKYFESIKQPLVVYDKYKKLGSVKEVNLADVVFIATPTPFSPKGGFDLSMVENAIGVLEGKKIIVIKSTVLPGTTEALQKKYPRHKFMFNPEFLREISAYKDLIHPDRQLLGVTKESRSEAKKVMAILPRAPYEKIMPAASAETVKYMANSFLALKVVFANEFYDICQKLGVDYSQVKEAVTKDARIGDSHFDVSQDNYRGYGGSCFPKDVNAIIQDAEKRKVGTPLLKMMREINRGLLKASGTSEEYFLAGKHKKDYEKKR